MISHQVLERKSELVRVTVVSRLLSCLSHPLRVLLFTNSKTLTGCTSQPAMMGVGAPHQCPLGSIASYLCPCMLTVTCAILMTHHIPKKRYRWRCFYWYVSRRCEQLSRPSHPLRVLLFTNSKTLTGCTSQPAMMGVGAPHQCPLGSIASYLCPCMLTVTCAILMTRYQHKSDFLIPPDPKVFMPIYADALEFVPG